LNKNISQSFQVLKSTNLSAGWCDESECGATLKRIFEETGYCLDPHTAVAMNVAERKRTSKDVPVRIGENILKY
jgi:threonine synthase